MQSPHIILLRNFRIETFYKAAPTLQVDLPITSAIHATLRHSERSEESIKTKAGFAGLKWLYTKY